MPKNPKHHRIESRYRVGAPLAGVCWLLGAHRAILPQWRTLHWRCWCGALQARVFGEAHGHHRRVYTSYDGHRYTLDPDGKPKWIDDK